MQRTNIYLSDEQVSALDQVADARGVSRAEVIRDFVERGLNRENAGIEEDLLAISQTFGALRDEDVSLARDAGDRERHLADIRRRPALIDDPR